MSSAWLLAVVVVLVVSLVPARRALPGTAWLLLRSLLPAWRFFEDVESSAELMHRSAAGSGEDAGAWQRTIAQPPRGVLAILYNPQGNLALAAQSLVEHLTSDLDGCRVSDVEGLVSYQLTRQLVERRVRSHAPPESARYQFRLCADGEELFRSEWHSL